MHTDVCIGSIVVTTLDSGPGGPGFESRVGANILWGSIDCTGLTRALHPFGVVHWVPEQLNIKAVTGACKLIDGCSLKSCVRPHLQWHHLAYATEIKVNSTAWLYRGPLPEDSNHYITHWLLLIGELQTLGGEKQLAGIYGNVYTGMAYSKWTFADDWSLTKKTQLLLVLC